MCKLTLLLDGFKSIIGKGTYGTVVDAVDNTTKSLVAIKIVSSDDVCRMASNQELDILLRIAKQDTRGKR
jgi:hypothetical protein